MTDRQRLADNRFILLVYSQISFTQHIYTNALCTVLRSIQLHPPFQSTSLPFETQSRHTLERTTQLSDEMDTWRESSGSLEETSKLFSLAMGAGWRSKRSRGVRACVKKFVAADWSMTDWWKWGRRSTLVPSNLALRPIRLVVCQRYI